MAAMTSALRTALPNRRRRVRHKIQTPAYATFTAESESAMLDLHEIIDISEEGVAIQCHATLEPDRRVNLCLDLAECDQHIYTAGQVIWTNGSGRAGLRFSALPPASLFRLREWLFLNAMAGVANAEAVLAPPITAPSHAESVPPRPDYTDTLTAVSAVQREVEAVGADLAAALQLIAGRAQTLVRASGSAIALATADPNFMDCRASAGPGAPPVGARLQVGSGFSGECVQTGRLLRCDDADLDSRVDAESCRALDIRSILAVPVCVGEKSIGILEAFSAQPNAFSEADSRALQRLAETVLAAVNRAARAEDLPTLEASPAANRFAPTPGSVLFASTPGEEKKTENAEEKRSSGITLPRSYLTILIVAATAIPLVLGYNLAPWIQAKRRDRGQSHLQTVLASSQSPRPEGLPAAAPEVETATIDQLRLMAERGNPAAENALGLRYFQGDEQNGIRQNEQEGFHWFSSAAEHGSLAAQTKLGFLYWSGRGAPKDLNKAYFWTVLARARGDEGNKDLAAVLASGMTRDQTAAIEQQADAWLRQHSVPKPEAGH
jgi:GAF domain-containing protein